MTKDTIFIFIVFYIVENKNLSRQLNNEFFQNSAEMFNHTIERWRTIVPNNVYILDMIVANCDKSHIDIICSNGLSTDDDKLKSFIKTLQKVLQRQFANININDSKEFFNYETAPSD